MSASASTEEFIEVLNAEQHVELPKLKDYARHGVQAAVRGEVWLYLLGVLSDDKSQEMTSVRSKYLEYDSLDKHNAFLEKRIRSECTRYYQKMLVSKPPPGRTLARSSQKLMSRPSSMASHTAAARLDGPSHPFSNVFTPSSRANSSQGSPLKGNAYSVTRGPNRVDTGRGRALAGIMGGHPSSSSPSTSSSHLAGNAANSSATMSSNIAGPSSDDELLDPEAMAAIELKHFCNAVQNIISAYLNRAKWEALQGQHQEIKRNRRDSFGHYHRRRLSSFSAGAPTTSGEPLTVSSKAGNRSRSGSVASSSGQSIDGKSVGSNDGVVDTPSTEELKRPKTSSGLAPRSRASTVSSHSSGASSPRPKMQVLTTSTTESLSKSLASLPTGASSANRGTHRQSGAKNHTSSSRRLSSSFTSPFPSLPKEYEWAHQTSAGTSNDQHHHLRLQKQHQCIHPPFSDPSSPQDESNETFSLVPVQTEYHPDMVFLCAPFVKCIRAEAGMYFAFEKLMGVMERYHLEHPLPSRISSFLTLFRTTLPELYAYFDEEEVDIIGLASAWLRHLLAAEMRIEDLMRLWDTYFAMPDFLDLHTYVCLAILTNCKDALEELDQSEAKSMLFSLPPLDVDRILNEAINIRLSHRQSEASNGQAMY